MNKSCKCEEIAPYLEEINSILRVMTRALKSGDGVEQEMSSCVLLLSNIVAEINELNS